MSIRIHHGYRAHTRDPQALLAAIEAVVAPVRDDLDATLYATLAAEAHDHAWRGTQPYTHDTLRDEALALFHADVTGARYGTVWHHPHSLDIDHAYPPTQPDGPLYLLVHAQRDAYRQAILSLPDVEEYGYWTNTDTRPDGVSKTAWTQRATDWEWLNNGRIPDHMTRWTHRDDPAPTVAHVTDPTVFTAHLPTPETRARHIARDLAVTEARDLNPDMDINDLIRAMTADTTLARTSELAPLLLPHLPPLDADSLHHPQPAPTPLPRFAR